MTIGSASLIQSSCKWGITLISLISQTLLQRRKEGSGFEIVNIDRLITSARDKSDMQLLYVKARL